MGETMPPPPETGGKAAAVVLILRPDHLVGVIGTVRAIALLSDILLTLSIKSARDIVTPKMNNTGRRHLWFWRFVKFVRADIASSGFRHHAQPHRSATKLNAPYSLRGALPKTEDLHQPSQPSIGAHAHRECRV